MFAPRRNFLPASLALLLAATAAPAAVAAPHGWLGVTLNNAEQGPLSVEEVMEGGPAAKAGVKAGDVIVSWNGAKVANLDDLRAFLEKTKAGDEGLLGLRRGDKEVFAKVVLGDRAKALEEMGEGEEVEEVAEMEIDLDDVTDEVATQDEAVEIRPAHQPGGAFLGVRLEPAEGGVAISSIVDGSPAQRIGINAGEVIRSIDGQAVETAEQVVKAVQAKKPGDRIELKTTSADGEFTYVFPLGTAPAAPAAPRLLEVEPGTLAAPVAPLRPRIARRAPEGEATTPAPHGEVAPGLAHPEAHAQHEIAALRAEIARLHAEMAEMKAMLAEIHARLKK